MLSQIIRFTLPVHLTISADAFTKLRQRAATAGALAQYYCYTWSPKPFSSTRQRHEICWAIHWPNSCDRKPTMTKLNKLTRDARSLLFEFEDNHLPELQKAFEAPVCEFACIRLTDNAPLEDASLQHSMDKTYLDTYKLRGFTGGQWSYAINSNDVSGVPCCEEDEGSVPPTQRRLGIYFLGWESMELHEDATETPEFAEEVDKLRRWFGRGTGALWAMFQKH